MEKGELQHRGIELAEAQLRGGSGALASLGLTAREREVLALVAEGKTDREIALIACCAPKTVEKHLEHIYAKLQVSNRAAAVATALGVIMGGWS